MRFSLLLAALAFSPAALAAGLAVTTLDDELNADGDCSLREAIEAANTDTAVDACGAGSGTDQIVFDAAFAGAALTLALGELVVSSDVRIGAFDSPFVTLVAGPGARHLRVTGGTVFVEQLGFRSGVAGRGGAVFVEAGAERFSARNAIFENNVATGDGGGALWIEGGMVSAAYTSFGDNSAPGGTGGAVHVAGGSFSTGSELLFTLNSATDGGAVAVSGGSAEFGFAKFRENTAVQRGGALFVSGDAEQPPYVFLQATRFGANAARNGGAVWSDGRLESQLPAIATNRVGEDPYGRSVFEGNTALENGGAIYLADPAATLAGLLLRENLAGDNGGGLYVAGGSSVRLETSIVQANQAGAADASEPVGAGIAVMNDPETDGQTALVMMDTWVDGNSFWVEGTGLGGGVYGGGAAGVLIYRSTLSNNRAVDGGGVWSAGDLYLENATLTQNAASESGGGVFVNVPPGECSEGFAQFATISENEAGTDGGGISCPPSESPDACFTIGSSILANNTVAGGPSDCSGRVWTTNTNLVTVEDGCIAGGTLDGSVIAGEDPLLLPLAPNGGWTPTMALQPGSPAEDIIELELFDRFDQRGFLRPGRPDLGAFEIAGIELAGGAAAEPVSALRLNAPAPNPAMGRVSVAFVQPSAGPARLVLHDVLGREVLVIHDAAAATEHEATVDVRALSPGLYVLRLTSGGQQATRKMTVVR